LIGQDGGGAWGRRRGSWCRRLAKSLAEGRAFQSEVTAERADGSTYALELHVMPAASSGPRTLHWIGIGRDVPERKSQLACCAGRPCTTR
jgi:hypothetical protein